MLYAVTARFIPDTAAEFHRLLTDGTIESRKPDGREIVASMKRAKIDESGIVRWSEVCYRRRWNTKEPQSTTAFS